jgi:hypothetical protein
MLAKAKALAKAKVKHIYSIDIIYDRHLRSSKYFCNTSHRSFSVEQNKFFFAMNHLLFFRSIFLLQFLSFNCKSLATNSPTSFGAREKGDRGDWI